MKKLISIIIVTIFALIISGCVKNTTEYIYVKVPPAYCPKPTLEINRLDNSTESHIGGLKNTVNRSINDDKVDEYILNLEGTIGCYEDQIKAIETKAKDKK